MNTLNSNTSEQKDIKNEIPNVSLFEAGITFVKAAHSLSIKEGMERFRAYSTTKDNNIK